MGVTHDDMKMRAWIADYIDKHNGVSPYQREIAEGLGIHRRTVEDAVQRLEMAGLIKRQHGKRRSLRVPKPRSTTPPFTARVAEVEGRMDRLERMHLDLMERLDRLVPEAAE